MVQAKVNNPTYLSCESGYNVSNLIKIKKIIKNFSEK